MTGMTSGRDNHVMLALGGAGREKGSTLDRFTVQGRGEELITSARIGRA